MTQIADSPEAVPDTPAGRLKILHSKQVWLMAIAMAALACIGHILFSHQRGMWCDEYLSVATFDWPLRNVIEERLNAGHSPLYFLCARVGLLLGRADWQLRAPTAIAYGAAFLFLTGVFTAGSLRRYLPVLWGIMVIQPYWITLATQVRYMMPLLAAESLMLWLFMWHINRPTLLRAVLLCISIGLAGWISITAHLVAIPLLAFAIWNGRKRIKVSAPVVAGILLSTPLIYLTRDHSRVSGRGWPEFGHFGRALLETVFGDYHLWPQTLGLHTTIFSIPQVLLLIATVVLARRQLLLEKKRPLWRLLLCLLIGIPAVFALFCATARGFDSVGRYLAAFAIPVVLCMALAWHAKMHPISKWLYRGALMFVLLTQSLATTIDHNDYYREALDWLVDNQRGAEPIVASSATVNRYALQARDFPQMDQLVGVATRDSDRKDITARIEKGLENQQRGFFIVYFSQAPVLACIQRLQFRGVVLAERHWKISGKAMVGAMITNESEREWLMSLPGPQLPWGPTRYIQE